MHVDLSGPWTVFFKHKLSGKTWQKHIHTYTVVDRGTSWMEIKGITSASAIKTANIFKKEWLCHYPHPHYVTYDNGKNFWGYEIESNPTTVKNPQANFSVEQMHLLMGDVLCMKVFKGDCLEDELDTMLQAMVFAFRSTVSPTIDYSPAQLVFGHDMILGWKVAVDFDQGK